MKNSQALQKQSVRKIVDLLKKPHIFAQLHLALSTARLHQKFTKKCQSEAPLIHLLYVELLDGTLTVAGRVCKTSALKEAKKPSYDWLNCQLFNFENLLPLGNIILEDVSAIIPAKETKLFLKNVQSHYITGASHLFKKTTIPQGKVLRSLGFLNPKFRN